MADQALTTDVLVVGGGPTGLMLANWLALFGVDVLLVDAKLRPTRESRAVVVQARSMEIYDELGLADAMLRASAPAAFLSPGYGRRSFGRIPIGELGRGVTPFPRLYVVEQSRNEAILYDNLRSLGHDVLWRHRLVDLERSASSGVTATLTASSGRVSVRARYCIGADGSGSTVRRLAGIPFEGTTNENAFYVCDATGVKGLSHDAVTVRLAARDFLLAFPMAGSGHFRLIGVKDAPTERAEQESTDGSVRARVDRAFGVRWGESSWFSTYRVHHRVAAVFRDGPVFLAGDAAHVHSPVGGQGMNTGLQDAHGLALKLVDVLRHGASERVLDEYEAERRPVARHLVAVTDRLFRIATSPALPARLLRRLLAATAAPLAVRVVPRLPAAPRLFEYVSQVRIRYRMPDATGRRDPVVGRRLPWTGGDIGSLGAEWQVHAYGSVDSAIVERVARTLGIPVRIFGPDRYHRLAAGVFYLVRPDRFVVAASATSDTEGDPTLKAAASAEQIARAFRALLPPGLVTPEPA